MSTTWNPRKIVTNMTKEEFKEWCIENRDNLKYYIDSLAEDPAEYDAFEAWVLTEYDLRTWNALINSTGEATCKKQGAFSYKYLVGKPTLNDANIVDSMILEAGDGIVIDEPVIDKTAKTTTIKISTDGTTGEPEKYLKSASVDGNTLTLINKDDTTVEFTPTGTGSGKVDDVRVDGITVVTDKVANIVLTDYAKKTDVTGEATTREEADATLQAAITLEQERALTAESELEAKIPDVTTLATKTELTTETTERTEADTALETKITNIESLAATKSALSSEVSRATAKETELSSKIPTKTSDLTNDSNFTTASDVTTALAPYITTATANNTFATKTNLTSATTRISTIEDKISTSASSSNKLVSKTELDTAISQSAARYITSSTSGGNFASKEALIAGPWYYNGSEITLQNTDYAIVSSDEEHSNAQTRYIYTGSWNFQYVISTAFTEAQQAALDSGINTTKVSNYDGYAATLTTLSSEKFDISNIVSVLPEDPSELTNSQVLGAKIAYTTIHAGFEDVWTTVAMKASQTEVTNLSTTVSGLSESKADTSYVLEQVEELTTSINNEASTRITNDNALGTRITTLETNSATKTELNTEATTRSNADSALEASIAAVEETVPDESTVSGWGFTKNTGTITGITMNGSSKGTSGVVDLGNVITSTDSCEKTANKVTSLSSESTDTQYPSAKCVYEYIQSLNGNDIDY